MELIYDRSCAPECKSGIQGLAIIRLRTGSEICGYMGGGRYMLIKLKSYVQMKYYKGKII